MNILYLKLKSFLVTITGVLMIADRKTRMYQTYVGSRDYIEAKRSWDVNLQAAFKAQNQLQP